MQNINKKQQNDNFVASKGTLSTGKAKNVDTENHKTKGYNIAVAIKVLVS